MSDLTFTQETVDRFHRWLANIGFDGGVDSPPFMLLGVALAQRDRIEKLEAALEKARVYIATDLGCGVVQGVSHVQELLAVIVEALQSGEARGV